MKGQKKPLFSQCNVITVLYLPSVCGPFLKILIWRSMLQIRGMHTLIRDLEISKHDFVFYSDRLIRLVLSSV